MLLHRLSLCQLSFWATIVSFGLSLRSHHEKVQLVMCVEESQFDAALTVVNSVFSTCGYQNHLFHVHFITMRESLLRLRAKINCFSRLIKGGAFSVYSFQDFFDPLHLGFRVHDLKVKGHAGLDHPLNFARFYLDTIIDWARLNTSKVMYMDTDCLAQACIVPLYYEALTRTEAPVAAAWRKNVLGSAIDFSHPIWSTLNSSMLGTLSSSTIAFNAGVLVIDLARWEQLNILGRVQFWSNANNAVPLYKLGSNPPLVLALAGNVEYFSHAWNYEGLGGFDLLARVDKQTAKIIHWSGRTKPWMRMSWMDKLLKSKRDAQNQWDSTRVLGCEGDGHFLFT